MYPPRILPSLISHDKIVYVSPWESAPFEAHFVVEQWLRGT